MRSACVGVTQIVQCAFVAGAFLGLSDFGQVLVQPLLALMRLRTSSRYVQWRCVRQRIFAHGCRGCRRAWVGGARGSGGGRQRQILVVVDAAVKTGQLRVVSDNSRAPCQTAPLRAVIFRCKRVLQQTCRGRGLRRRDGRPVRSGPGRRPRERSRCSQAPRALATSPPPGRAAGRRVGLLLLLPANGCCYFWPSSLTRRLRPQGE